LQPGQQFGFSIETGRRLLNRFSLPPSDVNHKEVEFVNLALDPVLKFLSRVKPVGDLPCDVVNFLATFRPIVAERDYGIMSYGLGRALAGDIETCSASLFATVVAQLELMISSNAAACHRDEYLEPMDAFRDAVDKWRVRTAPIILAMLDMSEQQGHVWPDAEDVIWNGFSREDVEHILGALERRPLDDIGSP
jgi:hypothetical protein